MEDAPLSALFNGNYLLKGPVSKYSRVPRFWGLGLQYTDGDPSPAHGTAAKTEWNVFRSDREAVSGPQQRCSWCRVRAL